MFRSPAALCKGIPNDDGVAVNGTNVIRSSGHPKDQRDEESSEDGCNNFFFGVFFNSFLLAVISYNLRKFAEKRRQYNLKRHSLPKNANYCEFFQLLRINKIGYGQKNL
ncbi:unnamed protein product [Citrullus colocynthis]|uniref:Uncharacterized protein n=1 Tax=Citrullus colocynthis TaxID=252529 RepID=A0ABP0XYC0_9ROSI